MEQYGISVYSTFILVDYTILEFSWKEETENMTDIDFKIENMRYANLAEKLQVSGLLIDVEKFKFKFDPGLNDWRSENIIPKYNRAGVKRMAFLHDSTFDVSNVEVTTEGNYMLSRFNNRLNAVEWLKEDE